MASDQNGRVERTPRLPVDPPAQPTVLAATGQEDDRDEARQSKSVEAVEGPDGRIIQAGFPQTETEFEADDRVSYSKGDNKWVLEAEDGTEYQYEEALRRWVPLIDESLLEKQREAYGSAGGNDEEEAAEQNRKRRRKEESENGTASKKSKKQNGDGGASRKNTAIYVTNLPFDTELEEVNTLFSRCGVIAEEIDSGGPRIRLYKDDDGNFKGDALVVYFRPESVDLAIQMMDDTEFRLGQDSGKMRIQAADFSYKSQQGAPPKSNARDKKKIIRRTQKLNNKLADWDDDDPSALPDTSSRYDKVVILKHMFTLKELEEDPAAMLDIKEDIRDECSKLGEVTNVVLFDKEQDGVASVRFSNAEAAQACVQMMNGRFFSGTKVVAFVSTGSEKFKKSSKKEAGLFDDEPETGQEGAAKTEGQRLDQFGNWLEGQK